MLVIGIDPGTATTGYGLVRENEDGSLALSQLGLNFACRQCHVEGGKAGAKSDEALLAHIRAIHAEVRQEYGWPRMTKELCARGCPRRPGAGSTPDAAARHQGSGPPQVRRHHRHRASELDSLRYSNALSEGRLSSPHSLNHRKDLPWPRSSARFNIPPPPSRAC